MALFSKKSFDEAGEAYRRAAELEPKNAIYLTNFGAALISKNRIDEGIEVYRKAIKLDPKFMTAHSNLAGTLSKTERFDETIEACKELLKLDPKSAEIHFILGIAQSSTKRSEEAIASYNKVIELDSKHTGAHRSLAWLLVTCPETKLRDSKRAVVLAKKLGELAPNVGATWWIQGVAHYRDGDWKAAIAALEKTNELSGAFFLAMAHRKLGHDDEARKIYDRAVEWLEKNKEVLAKNKAKAAELRSFQKEAEEVLGLKK
jgi:tetratricopeptide (TPR) repeat protein